MQFVSAPPLPRLKIGSLLPGYPLSTPLTFQAKIRAVTALLNGVTASYRSCRNSVSDLLIHSQSVVQFPVYREESARRRYAAGRHVDQSPAS